MRYGDSVSLSRIRNPRQTPVNFRDSRSGRTRLLSICQLEERLDISIKVANNILPISLKQNQKVQAQNKTNVWTPPLFQ